MDPDACLQRWRDANKAKDRKEASRAINDLVRWLAAKGFQPTGLTKRERNTLNFRLNYVNSEVRV